MEVLDQTEGFTWLGSLERSASSKAWRLHQLLFHVPEEIDGHTLDVSLTLDDSVASYQIDDLELRGALRPETTLLNASFEDGGGGLSTYTSSAVEGGPSLELEAPSAAAARKGRYGASLKIKGEFPAASDAK